MLNRSVSNHALVDLTAPNLYSLSRLRMQKHSVDHSVDFAGGGVRVLENSRGATQLSRHFDIVTVTSQPQFIQLGARGPYS